MPGIPVLLKILLSIFAGVGVASAMDKFLPGKAPNYEPISPGFRPMKLLYFALAFGIGAWLWKTVDRKFHILTRRHSPRRRKSRKR